ncbi:MAG: 1-aminocyclopropane-1-carboxylate deaminase/D-cysteine desulfhydrase [Polaribacter sp.]
MIHTNTSFFNTNFTTENQPISLPILEKKKVVLFIKREDLIHPFVSGNKFRKLKYNFLAAKEQQKKMVLTFGGAFSNHILATAVAANLNGLSSIGIIRGEELGKNFQKTISENFTLREAYKNGMIFHFVSREMYRKKMEDVFMNQLEEKFGDFYLIPEGGTNDLAIKGCKEILKDEYIKFNYICCAVGTGGTISGLIEASKKHQKIIGFPALKGNFLSEEIRKFTSKNNWSLNTAYHFGGYGKYNEALVRFINSFAKQTGVLLDPIYTGKMLFGLLDLIAKDIFPKNSKILAIHTGGIQGIEGFNEKLKKKNQQIIKCL